MSDPITVLHVDDDQRIVDLVRTLLERSSFDVRSETRADDALEHLEDEAVDCVLCDYKMPETDGLAFFEAVRESRPELPFILLTARGSERLASEAISAGVSDYVPKDELGQDRGILANRIENLVSQYRSKQRAIHQERLNAVIREVNRRLVRSSTREEIERGVCRAITETDLYDGAWIGSCRRESTDLVSREATSERLPPSAVTSRPVDRALDSGSVAVVRDAQPEIDPPAIGESIETWREATAGLECRTTAAVPIEYEDERYGVVVVLSGRTGSFDETERSVLTELADDIAHAIHAVETRERLRRREKHLSQAQSIANLGSWYKDIDEDAIRWSDEVYHIFDRSREKGSLDHEEFMSYVHPDDREFVQREWDAAKDGAAYDVVHRIVTGDETKWVREKADLEFGDDGVPREGVGVVQDVTEQKEYERRLKAVNEAMSRLHGAESREDAGRTVVEILSETLEDVTVGVNLLDSESGVLEPISYVTADGRPLEEPPAFEPGGGSGWETFLEGSRRTCREADCDTAPKLDPSLSWLLLVPIEDVGLVVIGTDSDDDAFDERTAELVEIVASAAREAIARIDRERYLDENEARLRERTVERDRLNRITQQGRRVLQAIVDADDRSAIETGVCERLAETEEYAFVWLGHVDSTTDRLVPAATAGDGQEYLSTLDRSLDGETTVPSVRTARTREPTRIVNTAEGVRDEPWRREAIARGFRSVLSLPLQIDDVMHGVLTICADDVDVFDDVTRDALVELGRTIAYGVSSATQRDALHGSRTVEIVLEITDEACPWLRIARETGYSLEIESTVPRENGTVGLLTVPETDGETARDRLATVPSVASVSTSGDDGRLRVTLTQPDVSQVFSEVGGRVGAYEVDPTHATVRVELPGDTDVRSVVEQVADRYDETNLVSRSVVEPGPTAEAPGPALLEDLTQRQRDALRTAYHEGFFAWPRETTIEELAAVFDVASPTYSRHLRIGQRKLLDNVFDDS